MAQFIGADLTGSRFQRVDLADSRFQLVRLSGVEFRGCELVDTRFRIVEMTGVVMRGVELHDVEIHGDIGNLTINGVEVGALVEAELDRRHPERAGMRPSDAAGFRAAWEVVERLWDGTVERARHLDPDLLHESVDGEWSFIETLTDESLDAGTEPVEAPGWPDSRAYRMRDVLLLVLHEEWEHRLYAERDLAALEAHGP